jgi:hypothetical protein
MRWRQGNHKRVLSEKATKLKNKERSWSPFSIFEITKNPKLASLPMPKDEVRTP